MLSRNKFIKLYPKLGRQWYLSFSVLPSRINNLGYYTNILHMTTGPNSGWGSRPIVFMKPRTTALYICAPVGRNWNYCFSTRPLPLRRFSHVLIQQTWNTVRNVYEYSIRINGETELRIVNPSPRDYYHVRMYAANPWNYAAPAILRNLAFANLPHGKSYILMFNAYIKTILQPTSTLGRSFSEKGPLKRIYGRQGVVTIEGPVILNRRNSTF